jgi:hypothetical protein
VYDFLSHIVIYRLRAEHMRGMNTPSSDDLLATDGSNIASVFRFIQERVPETRERIVEYLRRIAPNVRDVTATEFGPYESLEFLQRIS